MTKQFERSNVILRAALRCARSEASDQDAVKVLNESIGDDVGLARVALGRLGNRTDFETDRARRVLRAAIKGTAVEAPNPNMVGLFMREEQLGRLPINEALTILIELEPEIEKIYSAELAGKSTPSSSYRSPKVGRNVVPPETLLSAVVGPNSQHSDELMRSTIALSVAAHCLSLQTGLLNGDTASSYFSAPLARVVKSGRLT